MAYKDRPPLTNEEGDVRELTEEDFVWFVSAADFGSDVETMQFLRDRNAFFKMAERFGFTREAFVGFEPCKPGFIERASEALTGFASQVKHAAE